MRTNDGLPACHTPPVAGRTRVERIAAVGIALVVALVATRAGGEEPVLRVPADCAMGAECVIQNYVDHDARSGKARDYRCGHLSYHGHGGTDIRVPTTEAMATGVEVVAAASGRVVAVRDGMPDAFPDNLADGVLEDRQAGNGVVIDHGGGWQTQYSHLRLGTVAVQPGETVEAGTVLGQIGLSGTTEFPHVEFSVRQDGRTIDPFTGTPPQARCDEAPTQGNGLWSSQAAERLNNDHSALLASDFSAAPPERRGIKSGAVKSHPPRVDADALVFWGLFYGLSEGDRLSLRLHGPDDQVIAKQTHRFEDPKAEWLGYVGKERERDWPSGVYQGVVRIHASDDEGSPAVHRRELTLETP